MADGPDFVRWCARQGVPLILHGHKHVANHARGTVDVRGESREVDAIGCGSSTGAGDYPLSFNVLTWEPRDFRWIASFYADPGERARAILNALSSAEHFAAQHLEDDLTAAAKAAEELFSRSAP